MQSHAGWDLYVFHTINNIAGNRPIDAVIDCLNTNIFIRGAILVTPYIFLWALYRQPEDRAKLVAGMVGAFVAVAVCRGLAHVLPFETRPMFTPGIGYHRPSVLDDPGLENWSSFPSDTAAYSVALMLGLFSTQRVVSLVMTALAFAAIAFPRIYAGIHYPSDVLAGSMIGAATAAAANLQIVRRFCLLFLDLEQRVPAVFYTIAIASLFEISELFAGVRAVFKLSLLLLHK